MSAQSLLDGYLQRLSSGRPDFVAQFGLWSPEQHTAAQRILALVEEHQLEVVRVGFADPHGIVRSKTLTTRVFLSALRNGMDYSLGPFMFDTGLDLVLDPFAAGAGLGLTELEGASDFVAVPDPLTFRILPWAERTGWILADEYFKDGTPLPFSGRHALRRLLAQLAERDMRFVIGLEVEWYLSRLTGPAAQFREVGGFGQPGAAPDVLPVDLGYQFNIEWYNDRLDHILRPLRNHLVALDLPLRTTEHESGPGQLEFTFDPLDAMAAADAMVLFRTAVKQICGRHGYHASFMCKPALHGCDASGWHLHQSLFSGSSPTNLFMSSRPGDVVSPLARAFAGGLVHHAAETALLTTPTINGYRRYAKGHSLAPTVAGWAEDNRGAMIRILGEPFDGASHLENRIGEPAANPYLYIAAQLAAGMDGVDTGLDPGPLSVDPHGQSGPPLPQSLGAAVAAAAGSGLMRKQLGDHLIELLCRLKRNEIARFERWSAQHDDELVNGVSEWEQREYFLIY